LWKITGNLLVIYQSYVTVIYSKLQVILLALRTLGPVHHTSTGQRCLTHNCVQDLWLPGTPVSSTFHNLPQQAQPSTFRLCRTELLSFITCCLELTVLESLQARASLDVDVLVFVRLSLTGGWRGFIMSPFQAALACWLQSSFFFIVTCCWQQLLFYCIIY